MKKLNGSALVGDWKCLKHADKMMAAAATLLSRKELIRLSVHVVRPTLRLLDDMSSALMLNETLDLAIKWSNDEVNVDDVRSATKWPRVKREWPPWPWENDFDRGTQLRLSREIVIEGSITNLVRAIFTSLYCVASITHRRSMYHCCRYKKHYDGSHERCIAEFGVGCEFVNLIKGRDDIQQPHIKSPERRQAEAIICTRIRDRYPCIGHKDCREYPGPTMGRCCVDPTYSWLSSPWLHTGT